MSIEIKIAKGSIIDQKCDAVVNPANSFGYMGGGVAGVLKKFGGVEVEREAISKGPTPIGKAIVTTGGALPFKIIHAPTMSRPAQRTSAENVRKAVQAALSIAEEYGFSSVAMPGMGTGVGGMAPNEAAKIMIGTIKNFKSVALRKVILVDINDEMIKAWRAQL